MQIITPEQGRDEIQAAINSGETHVHLTSGEYLIEKPIFIQNLEKFTITSDSSAVLKHAITGSTQPFIYVLCPDTTISGLIFDFNRVEWWDYKNGIKTQVPDWYQGKDGHSGPRDVKKYNLSVKGNVVIDSQNRRKDPSQGDRGDNWFLVLKDSHDNFNLTVEGNRIKAPDLEITGGPQFFTNTTFHNNVVRGGKNTGGFISCLTKGQAGRRIQNLRITDNLCQELNNYWISVGYDSDDSSESIDFDNVLISGNKAVYGETPAKFCANILFKYANYSGVTQVFGNIIDGRKVSSSLTSQDFAPRLLSAKNTGVTPDEPKGHIYLERPKIIMPENAQWNASIPGTGRDRFETFSFLD